MSTLGYSYNTMGTTLKLSSSDLMSNFHGVVNIILGLVQILLGFFSVALGVGAICTWASGYYIGYGIWCGFVFLVAGCVQIAAGSRQTIGLIIATMSLSTIAWCCGGVQLSLGIVAAYNDSPSSGRNPSGLPPTGFINPWDIYAPYNVPVTTLCTGYNTYLGWRYAWGPVDVLLLIVGFLEWATALASVILGCITSCCGTRLVGVVTHGLEESGHTGMIVPAGISNEGYMVEPRMSPPGYKN